MRQIALIAALLFVPALSACSSFQPVYSGQIAEPSLTALAFTNPAGRLEQIVQQELALRFETTDSKTAPLATVAVQTSGSSPFLTSNTGSGTFSKAGATATITITSRDGSGAKPFQITRSAEAGYTTTGQVLADRAAANEALERAAKSAAESLRLALLGALARG
jgi:hypothetical protein